MVHTPLVDVKISAFSSPELSVSFGHVVGETEGSRAPRFCVSRERGSGDENEISVASFSWACKNKREEKQNLIMSKW